MRYFVLQFLVTRRDSIGPESSYLNWKKRYMFFASVILWIEYFIDYISGGFLVYFGKRRLHCSALRHAVASRESGL
jgi:hypothetical protein